MKTELTRKESAHLIDLGVDPKLASGGIAVKEPSGENEWESVIPLFKLTDILSILPKEIMMNGQCWLTINWNAKANQWLAKYEYVKWYGYSKCCCAPELIDALYQLLCWFLTEFKKKEK